MTFDLYFEEAMINKAICVVDPNGSCPAPELPYINTSNIPTRVGTKTLF
jgi:hypothetical protein